mgnify:CR=1 FL=1
MTNADKSGSWGACAFIITTFETNGKASRERVFIASCTPAHAFRSFVFSRLLMLEETSGKRFPQHTGVMSMGSAQARAETFRLKQERYAPVHVNCDATHQPPHPFNLRMQTTTAGIQPHTPLHLVGKHFRGQALFCIARQMWSFCVE